MHLLLLLLNNMHTNRKFGEENDVNTFYFVSLDARKASISCCLCG